MGDNRETGASVIFCMGFVSVCAAIGFHSGPAWGFGLFGFIAMFVGTSIILNVEQKKSSNNEEG